MTQLLAHILTVIIVASAAGVSAAQPQVDTRSQQLAEAATLMTQVVNLYAQGKFEEAYKPAKRALDLRDKLLAKDDPLVNSAVLNLAEVQFSRGRVTDSKSLFERLLDSYRRTLGPESPQLVPVMNRLAVVDYALGQPSETEKIYKRAVEIREKALGPTHRDTAASLYNLAEFYQFEGEFKRAEPYYQKLLDARSAIGDTSQIAEALDRYGCLLRKEKRIAEAEQIERKEFVTRFPAFNPMDVVISGIVNGTAIHLVTPSYPIEARTTRPSGKVTVRVLIDEDGNVLRACAAEGPPVFFKVSESAAARSTFTATTIGGKPVKVNGSILYNFIAQ